MAKDYANKPLKNRKTATRIKARKPLAKASPRWQWLLGGFTLGILTMVLVQGWENPQQDIAQTIDSIVTNKDTPPVKPRFDFYTLLPEAEVTIPNMEQSPVRGSQRNGDIFMLQAGSFRNSSDADSLRARLLLLNLDAHVEAATSQSAGTWHRVIVGPFKSRSQLANARATLLQKGIDNLVLKGREGG